jgi:hypothetical protein
VGLFFPELFAERLYDGSERYASHGRDITRRDITEDFE